MTTVKITPDASQVEAQLRALIERTGNASPAFAAVGRALVNFIKLGFRNSRSPWGESWLPIKFRAPKVQQVNRDGSIGLTPAGRKQLAANQSASKGRGAAGKPLVDTGLLRNSINFKADATGVDIGTPAKQARLQHFGGTIVPKGAKALAFPGSDGGLVIKRSVTIPARPFMPINNANQVVLPPLWAKAVLREIEKHVTAAPA